MPSFILIPLLIIAALAGAIVFLIVWPLLFGGWFRHGTWPDGKSITMAFLTRRGAERYGRSGLGAIDPYARLLAGPAEPFGGLLRRRRNR